MRPRIVSLDVDAMEWTPLGPPGLYSRMLSRDTETGARTALQRLVPADGYVSPNVAHYHTTYEEIIGIAGLFTFDHKTWIVPGSYVFHPPMTVHGFKSGCVEDSQFLSRVGQDLAFNFVPEPKEDNLYVVEGPVPPRAPVAYACAPKDVGWHPGKFLGQDVEVCPLSADPVTGEGSALVRVPAGWTSPAQTKPDYLEMFVTSGGLQVNDTPPPNGRAYFFYPPQDQIETMTAVEPTEIYVNFGAKLA